MDINDKLIQFDDKHKDKKIYMFLKRLIKQISEHDIVTTGAMLTYFFILSIFPFLIFLLSLISYTPLADIDILSKLLAVIPIEVSNIIVNVVRELVESSSETLLSISIIFSLYTSSKGVSGLVKAINKAYNTIDSRSFITHKIISVFLTLFVALLMIVILLTSVFGKVIINKVFTFLHIEKFFVDFYSLLRFVMPFILMMLIFMLLYYIGTDKKVKLKYVFPGAIFSSVVGIITSTIFAYYVENFGNFNVTYGSLGGVIVFLLWVNLFSSIIVIGAEINGSYMYTNEQILNKNNQKCL